MIDDILWRLTARQREVLDAIVSMTQDKGVPPTLRELGAALGIRSTNGVTDHLKALRRKGYLKERPVGESGDPVSRAILLTDAANEMLEIEAAGWMPSSPEGMLARIVLALRDDKCGCDTVRKLRDVVGLENAR